ncbi:hypothetical protein P4482_09250 [Neobacillus thermocopriae]|jgi:hypothetical protein|uniref:hypothetical protein n=1 Tax=Neobacillus thermocopriae TaxID=1215031 RepID=UPI002E1D631B|nr:hypothetical protein [Neobacillus thermocopriae]MED3714405.1 hypothetical protein [Neobacillus thermocopriae]
MNYKVKVFDDYMDYPIEEMNEFLKKVCVIDIKMNTVVAQTGAFFTRYLVIYKQK